MQFQIARPHTIMVLALAVLSIATWVPRGSVQKAVAASHGLRNGLGVAASEAVEHVSQLRGLDWKFTLIPPMHGGAGLATETMSLLDNLRTFLAGPSINMPNPPYLPSQCLLATLLH